MKPESYLDWCAANALRNYPLAEDVDPLPRGFLVDLHLFSGVTAPEFHVASASRGPRLISVVIADSTGAGVALLTRPVSDITPWEPMLLTPLSGAVTGTVTFGDVTHIPEFSVRGQLPIDFRAVVITEGPQVTSVSDPNSPAPLQGLVKLTGQNYIQLRRQENPDRLQISLDARTEILSLFSGDCIDASTGQCPSPPVRTLAGVEADETGTITLVIRNADN